MADSPENRPTLSLGQPPERQKPGPKPRAEATEKTEAAEKVSEQVTYLPGDGDPSQTKWHGLVFHANIPKTVTNPILIEQARTNKHFHVGPFDPAKQGVPTHEEVVLPKTPEQYRAWFAAWLKTMSSVDEMDQRWMKEEVLRESCGVGSDDLEYMTSLYQPKRAELRKLDLPA